MPSKHTEPTSALQASLHQQAHETRAGHEKLDARALSKLRWRCRRGLLENDLFIERFFNRYEQELTVTHEHGLYALMDLADNDLLDLLLHRKPLQGALDTPAVHAVLAMLAPACKGFEPTSR